MLGLISVLSSKKDENPLSLGALSAPASIMASNRSEGEMTILGAQKTIPYKVDIIRQAYNSLYEPDIQTLLPNHVYVRFLPQSPQDVKKIYESGFEFWDFPLDRELISIGERYHDPTVAGSTLTWLYAVVPVNKALPNVQHEILEQLALVPEDCLIAQKAFEITGLDYQAPDIFEPDPDLDGGTFNFEIGPGEVGGDPDGSNGPGNSPPTREACDCDLPDHIRKPSGCVKVEDNMLGIYDGVKEVKVITAKTQFFGFLFHRETHTDYAGCWMIDHKYHGQIHVWVKWQNGRCDIKTMESNFDLVGFTVPRKVHIGTFGGPNFNNIEITFDHTTAINSWHFRNWVASTINNSVYEFGGYMFNQGVLGNMPDDLKIMVTPWGSGNVGSAPMLDKIGNLSYFLGFSTPGIFIAIFNLAVGLPLVPIGAWLESAAPDMTFNLNDASQVNSDDIREIAYHELAHALHFGKVGSQYWLNHIFYIVLQDGYGDGTAPGASRCSVVESWGYQVGKALAHERYGANNSNHNFLPEFFTWRRALENEFAYAYTSSTAHIPYGWEWDLQDHNPTNPPNETEHPNVPNDRVHGFTNAQIFSKMDANMESIPQLRTALLQYLPPGVSPLDYDSLAINYHIQ